MLVAVKGYYDGTQIIVDESDRKTLNMGDEVIITVLDRLNTTNQKARLDKRQRVIDLEKYVMPSGRSVEEVNAYIRELRDNDRF
ncbi:MAG: hypothetical protein IJP31_05305 [Lachnospiraceae bacterium]|nr:hypothetical protein [Lachnospiraceae bacterium]